MGRLLLGIIKGGAVGAALGLLAGKLGVATGAVAVLFYGAVGAVVGLVCGRPLWKQETIWTPILKALFGFGLGVGVGYAGLRWLGGVHLPIAQIPGALEHPFPQVPGLFGPAVGILYGVLVEVDDAGSSDTAKADVAKAPQK
jgi:hypothetical protein